MFGALAKRFSSSSIALTFRLWRRSVAALQKRAALSTLCYALNAMRRRGASMFVRTAGRQAGLIFGMQRRRYHIPSSPALNSLVKSAFANTSGRSLQSGSWIGAFGNESRAWSPLVHRMSTAPASQDAEEVHEKEVKEIHKEKPASETSDDDGGKPAMTKSNYWGLVPKKLYKEDGTPWRWTCFSPHQTYHPDVTIDLEKHHKRNNWTDSIAYWAVKSLRLPTDLFFQKRYGCRAMMLETVAAVPGMVGGMLLHFKSLRKFETSGGWIKALLEEAENERMHLMTFMEVAQPKWWERGLVFLVQGVWFNAYFLAYVLNPKFAHRLTGYLEEEAIWSYSHFLQEIDNGHIPNGPAPTIAKDYWRLPENATIRDVVIVVRADEAHHRDVNHFAADLHEQGKELRDSPAPIGYQ